jgi:hypothetical protein
LIPVLILPMLQIKRSRSYQISGRVIKKIHISKHCIEVDRGTLFTRSAPTNNIGGLSLSLLYCLSIVSSCQTNHDTTILFSTKASRWVNNMTQNRRPTDHGTVVRLVVSNLTSKKKSSYMLI